MLGFFRDGVVGIDESRAASLTRSCVVGTGLAGNGGGVGVDEIRATF